MTDVSTAPAKLALSRFSLSPILRIAASELRSLFVSPIAWLLLVVFMLQVSMAFVERFDHNVRRVAFEGGMLSSFTDSIFARMFSGVFDTAIINLYLYVPLLTMGLIARELHSGSIKLALSSPLTLRQFIVGKYLAAVGYFSTFAAFLLVMLILSSFLYVNLDWPYALTGLFGILLLAAAYASIGLFMSSLTQHQVVAAVGTLTALFVLAYIGNLGQRVPILADVAHWLSMSGRVGYLRAGLIVTEDVVYFLLIIVLFLSLTYFRLSAGRRVERTSSRVFKIILVVGTIAIAGLISSHSRLTGFADMTRTKMMTLSPGSQSALEEFKGPWSITVYANYLDRRSAGLFRPRNQRWHTRLMMDQFLRHNIDGAISYRFFYGPSPDGFVFERFPDMPLEEVAMRLAAEDGISSEDFLTEEDVVSALGESFNVYTTYFLIEWDGEARVLPIFNDAIRVPGEMEFATAFRTMIERPRNIAYVSGQGERSAVRRGAINHQRYVSQRDHRFAMVNQGFTVRETALDVPVSQDIDIVVVAAPQESYSDMQLGYLRTYIERGGNLVVMGEPGSIDPVAPILAELGVSMIDGVLTVQSEQFAETTIFSQYASDAAAFGFTPDPDKLDNPVVLDTAAVLRSLDSSTFTTTPVLTGPGDELLAIALERSINGTNQRVFVVGDADLISAGVIDSEELESENIANWTFVRQLMSWLTEGAYPLDDNRPAPTDNSTWVQPGQVVYLKYLLYGVFPLLVLAFGIQTIVRRRRR